MDRPVRVLHLEDDSVDAQIVADTLAADGIRLECTRVTSRAQFVTALEEVWDVILADYSVPGFDGVAAQQIARERRPEVPFVFVSGTIGEHVAIDRLKDGATDYVLKQRLSRLPAAVRRALQEAGERRERRKAEQEVRRLNVTLEQRVAERAGQLSAANRELARREAQLAEANAFLDSIIENLPVNVFVKDATHLRFVRINRATEEMFGFTRDEVIGLTDLDVLPREQAESFIAADRATLAGGSVVDIPEERVDTRHQGTRILHTRKIPICGRDGAPQYLLGISSDITERKAAEDALLEAQREAERANRAKSEFLSRMSHDLRTPLNAILGFAQLLDMESLPAEHADSVRQILRGGHHLLELVNEVLDIARIEAGHLSLSPEPVAVAEIVPDVVELVRRLAAERGIRISAESLRECTLYVRADRQRLRQVLVNLIGNAVKYNRDGGTVSVRCQRSSEERVRLEVEDTGHGIPAAKLELLFRPFERLGAEESAIEGTGLGLALSKGLTEAMGGSIGVQSVIDRGSLFWIELPQASAPAVAPEPRTETAAAGKATASAGTVLYVEDNRSNVRLLERVLARRPGVRLVAASRGATAVEHARRDRPRLILLDLHLPDVPGEEVLRRLWSDPETRSIPVAVLTADAMPAQARRLRAAGAVSYLTKPLNVPQLLGLIDEHLSAAPVAEEKS